MSRSNASRPVLTLAAALALQAAASLAWAGTTADVEQSDAVSFGAPAAQQAAAARYYRPAPDAPQSVAPADAAEVRASRAALAAHYYRSLPQASAMPLTREQVRAELDRARAAGQLPHPYRPFFDENDPLRAPLNTGMAQGGLQMQDTRAN